MKLDVERVRELCREKGLSLAAMLEEAGVSRNAYYNLSRKESLLPGSVAAIAERLGVEPVELVEGDRYLGAGRGPLFEEVDRCLTSFHTLFTVAEGDHVVVRQCGSAGALLGYYQALVALRRELAGLEEGNRDALRSVDPDRSPDSIDHYNRVCDLTAGAPVGFIRDAILQVLLTLPGFIEDPAEELAKSPMARALLTHAKTVHDSPLPRLMEKYRQLLKPASGELGRFRNFDVEKLRKDQWTAGDWTRPAFIEFVKHEFGRYSTLEYRDGELVVTQAKPVKPPDQFFGYEHTKSTLLKYFEAFASGQTMIPLIMDGPPGIGKTEMVLSYARKYRLQIVLAAPQHLNNSLGQVLELLRKSPRRTLLFFDDLDAEGIDWLQFRRCVSGTSRYPGNVAIALVTNEAFPENVYSRGQYVEIPKFSHEVCRAMIAGMLRSVGRESRAAIEQTGATYLLAFGQGDITEISPRSVVSFFDNLVSGRTKLMAAPGQLFSPDLFDDALARARRETGERQERASE